ncbi:MAG: glucosamine-6-phosphate deaminase [Candidatus Dadabacteria bacterium]
MNTIIENTYDELSKHAADDLSEFIKSKRNPLICTASGDSPAGLYKELVSRVNKNQLDISSWFFVGLDEWMGMNGQDEGSCRYYLDKQLFGPLSIATQRICFFNGRTSDPEKECQVVNDYITEHKGIDVAIVGLGLNGHVGMNEPGTPPHLHAHKAKIDLQTQQVGQKYFKEAKEISSGLTLGIADLLQAKKIMLIVSGSNKAGIVKKVLEEEISEQIPATLLRNHPGFSIYLDGASSQMISNT